MSSIGAIDSNRPPPSVFLSYASEDRQAARSISDALLGFGLEVWYDESELGGGDSWDQKIRKQIRECDYFMPLVSAQTEARHEGYFRREWRLAVERTLDMADDHTFLLPVVIDDTAQAGARVPEKFLMVQWLRVPGGRPTPALEALCRRIVSGDTVGPQPSRKAPDRPRKAGSQPLALQFPEFPREEPGQRIRFGVHVVGWTLRSAWIFFQRLPRWVRVIIYIWLCVALLSRGCTPKHEHAAKLSPASAEKLNAISDNDQSSTNKADVAKLGMQIARELTNDAKENAPQPSPLLAIPFTAPAGDSAAEKLADATFALVYGRIAISHRGQVALTKEPLPTLDLGLALERGRANHSAYVICGAIEAQASAQILTVKIASVADGSVLWSKSYPAASADPAKIASDVESKLPSLDSN